MESTSVQSVQIDLFFDLTGELEVDDNNQVTGASIGLAATVATWFVVVAAIGRLGLGGYQLQAATGLFADDEVRAQGPLAILFEDRFSLREGTVRISVCGP